MEVEQIDYARIDYAMKDGRICVFEINTNPTILEARWNDPAWESARRLFATKLVDAWRAIDDVAGSGPRYRLRDRLETARRPTPYRGRLLVRDVLQALGMLALERPLVRTIRRLRRLARP